MERDITRGQLEVQDSFLRRLDPRCKLYSLLGFVVLTMLSVHPFALAAHTLFFLLAYGLSGIRLAGLFRSARGVITLLTVTELINLIWTDPAVVGLTFWRMLLITLMSVIFSKTTAPREILDGLRTGFPITESAAMSLAIAFDFLPQLGREMEELKCAAISRGARLEEGSIPERIRDYIPLLIPLFRRTIRHAGTLADAMDLRGYNSGVKRSRMDPLRLTRRDKLTIHVAVVFAAGVILIRIFL